MASTVGIHTQGAQNMPWQDLRTARGGGDELELRFGACAVAVSLGAGRPWPRNPHTLGVAVLLRFCVFRGSNAMRLAPGCPRSCAGSTRSAPKVRPSRPAAALLSSSFFGLNALAVLKSRHGVFGGGRGRNGLVLDPKPASQNPQKVCSAAPS